MTNIPVDHREQKLAELLRAATNGDGTVDWSHAVAGYLLEHGVQLSEERPSLPLNAEDALANVVFDTVRMLQHAHPNVHLGSPQGVQWLVRGLVANGVRSVDSLRPPEALQLLKEMRNLAWGWKPNRRLHADGQALFESVKELLARGADSIRPPDLVRLLTEIRAVIQNGGGVMHLLPKIDAAIAGHPNERWPSEWSARLLDLIAEYGRASFAEGNKWSDDPEANESQERRSGDAWKAIFAMLRGADSVAAPEETK